MREATARYVTRRTGVETGPEQIVLVPGSKNILHFALLSLVEPGDEVLIPDPGYPIYSSLVSFIGATPVSVPIREQNDFRLDVDELRSLVTGRTRVLILNTPANPTGGVLTRADCEAIAAVAIEHDLFVVSDEIYARLVYEGQHVSPYSIDGMAERCVLMDGLSKAWAMCGWRLGYGAMPVELAERMDTLMINTSSCAAAFTQWAAVEAFEGPASDAAVTAMMAEFTERRDVVVEGPQRHPRRALPPARGRLLRLPQHRGDRLGRAGPAAGSSQRGGGGGAGGVRLRCRRDAVPAPQLRQQRGQPGAGHRADRRPPGHARRRTATARAARCRLTAASTPTSARVSPRTAVLARDHDLVALVRSIPAPGMTGPRMLAAVGDRPGAFLFESATGEGEFARFTFAGLAGPERFRVRRGRLTRLGEGEPAAPVPCADPLRALQEFTTGPRVALPDDLDVPFTGGSVGHLSYEAATSFERVARPERDPLDLPDAWWGRCLSCTVLDRERRLVHLITHVPTDSDLAAAHAEGARRLEGMAARLAAATAPAVAPAPSAPPRLPDGAANLSRDAFIAAVERCLEYIVAGDIFQVQVSRRFSLDFDVAPLTLYAALREANPSPYMFYLRTDDCALVGTSPRCWCGCPRRDGWTITRSRARAGGGARRRRTARWSASCARAPRNRPSI